MPAARNPNPGPAAARRRRMGDETAAARLTKHGWVVVPPEATAGMPDDVAAWIRENVPAGW